MTGEQRVPARVKVVHFLLAIATIAVAITAVSFFPVSHSESTPFASPAFQSVWTSETAAAARLIDLWGSEPLSWRVEPYAGAPNDRRVVQYFERGRMEVESGSSSVTLGVLALELTRGEIDLGDGIVVERTPPDISIDSGEPDDRIPTYLTLSRLIDTPAVDRSTSNQRITDWIDRTGLRDHSSTPEVRRYAQYVEESSHNLPDVTVELFQQPEFRNGRWIEAFGYPISEPFWSSYRRSDDMHPSLIQVFERRILIYTPGLESSRTFTIASSGRHYALWRYRSEQHAEAPEPPVDALDPGLTLSEGVDAWVYAGEIGTPIDMALSPTGHLMILTLEGRILKASSLDPDSHPDEFTVWAEGIDEPQGMVTRGDAVLVTADDRLWWYRDEDGTGVQNNEADLLEGASGSLNVNGKPVTNSIGAVFARTDENGDGDVLREIGSNEPLVNLDEVIAEPGPVEFADGDLFLAGTDDDGRTSLVLLPAVGRSVHPSEPVSVATFPRQSAIPALAIADEAIWAIGALGDVIVAVHDDEDGRIFALSRERGVNETEVVELASGLSRPTSLLVGLDGSIYVADADEGRVIRFYYSGQDSSS